MELIVDGLGFVIVRHVTDVEEDINDIWGPVFCLAAYDQCVISLAIGYGVSWIHYSMLYGIMINPSMLDVSFTNVSTSVEHV